MPTRVSFSRTFRSLLFLASALLLIAGCASHSKTGSDSKVDVQVKTQPDPSAPATPAAPAAPKPANTNGAQNEIDTQVQKAAAQPSAPLEGTGWKPLYDGHSLSGWAVTDFAGHGAVSIESGLIVVDLGDALSGINYTNGNVPTMNYEVALDAMKLNGSDFFCGLTFPVADSWCSLILGGWGGGVVGISSINGDDASENETSQLMRFENNRWYRVRARVTGKKIECWLDDKKIVELKTAGKTIGLRFGEIELSKPLGIATYQTTAAYRNIQIRPVEEDEK